MHLRKLVEFFLQRFLEDGIVFAEGGSKKYDILRCCRPLARVYLLNCGNGEVYAAWQLNKPQNLTFKL